MIYGNLSPQTTHQYFNPNGTKNNLYSNFSKIVQEKFGKNGTHHHLREDEKMEKLVNATKFHYQNNPHLEDMKQYVKSSLNFHWIKPYSVHSNF